MTLLGRGVSSTVNVLVHLMGHLLRMAQVRGRDRHSAQGSQGESRDEAPHMRSRRSPTQLTAS